MAWSDANFWLIIFAGFVVYIVWGMILNFVVEAYRNFDTIKVAVNLRNKQIDDWKSELDVIENRINTLKANIASYESEIKLIEQKMKKIPFNLKHFEKLIHEFVGGWVNYQVGANMGDEITNQTQSIYENYIENVKAGLINFEG